MYRRELISRVSTSVVFAFVIVLLPTVGTEAHEPPNQQFVPVSKINRDYVVIGDLGKPLGKEITVSGIIIEGHAKSALGITGLHVQRIDGRATQKLIYVECSPNLRQGEGGHQVYKLGDSVAITGFETGKFDGTPQFLLSKQPLVATRVFGFKSWLEIVDCKKIEPIQFHPREFIGREALLSGVAKNRGNDAMIATSKWELLVGRDEPWPEQIIGRPAEALGMVERNDDGIFRMNAAEKRLVRLEDQIDEKVILRGVAKSMNGHWWLEYRGIDLRVEKMNELVGRSNEMHFRPIEVRGVLHQEKLRSVRDWIDGRAGPTVDAFVVKDVRVKKLESLLSPEYLPYE